MASKGSKATYYSKKSETNMESKTFSRRNNALRGVWNSNDFIVCRIISTMARARMQIFTYKIQLQHKESMKGRVIAFVGSFILNRSFKSLTLQVKKDVPKLLGYTQAEVLLYEPAKQGLYCMSIQEIDAHNSIDPDAPDPGFETEFIVDEKKIVRFPINMGISGFALRSDAVCYINDYAYKRNTVIGPIRAHTSSCADRCLSLEEQETQGREMCKHDPFDRKIDNFIEVETIDNLVICSIRDEEEIGITKPIGVLQLFNRVSSDILQEDLVRLHYIRKLIGSMMVTCEMISIALELTVAMNR